MAPRTVRPPPVRSRRRVLHPAPPNEFGAHGLRPDVPLQGRCLYHRRDVLITRPRRWTTGRRPIGAISIAGPVAPTPLPPPPAPLRPCPPAPPPPYTITLSLLGSTSSSSRCVPLYGSSPSASTSSGACDPSTTRRARYILMWESSRCVPCVILGINPMMVRRLTASATIRSNSPSSASACGHTQNPLAKQRPLVMAVMEVACSNGGCSSSWMLSRTVG